MDPMQLLSTAGPAAIGAYLLIDRVFKFVNERNGSSPAKNTKVLVDQNEKIIDVLHDIRLDLANNRCEFRGTIPEDRRRE